MSKKLLKLAQERERLISECELQRHQIKRYVNALHTPIAVADFGFMAVKEVSKHPVWVLLSTVAVFKIFKPKSILSVVSRSFVILNVFRKLINKH